MNQVLASRLGHSDASRSRAKSPHSANRGGSTAPVCVLRLLSHIQLVVDQHHALRRNSIVRPSVIRVAPCGCDVCVSSLFLSRAAATDRFCQNSDDRSEFVCNGHIGEIASMQVAYLVAKSSQRAAYAVVSGR